MITLNLLPDIKKDYLRSQRVKRLFLVSAVLVSGAFIAVAVLLALFVFGAQQLHLNAVQGDIDEAQESLRSQPDLDKVVTIQKQLGVLPRLHDEKAAANRLSDYLSTIVPQDITLSSVSVVFAETHTATLTGAGPDPKAINVFVDTLKNANFEYKDSSGTSHDAIHPFSKIVLGRVAVEDEETTYQITMEYDPLLFDSTISDIKLTVPKITSSPSVQQRPVLFQNLESEEE